MDGKDQHADDSAYDQRPPKRARRTPPPAPHLSASQPGYSSSTTSNGHTGTNGASRASPLPPLSLSILGVEPLDEFIREVADWVHHMIGQRPDGAGTVEVEAKIGILRDKATSQRLQLPMLVETILVPNAIDCRFESNMSASQHKHFNTLLNNLKMAPTPASPSPINYAHLHVVDSFYSPDGARGERVRVTRDEKTGTVTACVRKIRLGSLDIYSPKRAADWRISVNVEVPVSMPIGVATLTRKKDRMSYAHEEFIIDLTQVTSTNAGGPKEVLHELEVEVARPEYLLSTAAKRGDPNVSEEERGAFDELIRAFVNNARILVRNAGDGWQHP
ncbi:mRNA triphosphatase CET1 [Wolfiporia cocos MD-104 SS10]|uniref:mRNA-capping enzyme subunit beta n=1 Tax=Wolfiporia cocos (strain MD-104) TaxID=742152 RepID=A0A2H3JBU4_WOLCO|nr:mRNA triphosphatase CET1 [Wolfiporia cocos MD-104 SS10]